MVYMTMYVGGMTQEYVAWKRKEEANAKQRYATATVSNDELRDSRFETDSSVGAFYTVEWTVAMKETFTVQFCFTVRSIQERREWIRLLD